MKYSILYHIAPTLLANKPSTLIGLTNFNSDFMLFKRQLDYLRESINIVNLGKDLNYWVIRATTSTALILFYREYILSEVLRKPENRSYLMNIGYTRESNQKRDLLCLQQRFSKFCPHEVGIFLGIPVSDVLSFIENKGKHYLFNGYWKVYHHPVWAAQTFRDYDETREVVKKILVNFSEANPPSTCRI